MITVCMFAFGAVFFQLRLWKHHITNAYELQLSGICIVHSSMPTQCLIHFWKLKKPAATKTFCCRQQNTEPPPLPISFMNFGLYPFWKSQCLFWVIRCYQHFFYLFHWMTDWKFNFKLNGVDLEITLLIILKC